MKNGMARAWLRDPNGLGATNTINRTELSAIHLAITHQDIARYEEDLTIYSDSLCSIQLIRKMVFAPERVRESKHLELLKAIVEALELRSGAGSKTTIQKVKAHSGIVGNDQADKYASDMAKGRPASKPCIEPSTEVPYESVAWPAKASVDGPHIFFDNLTASVKGHLIPALQAGQSNETLYVQLNRSALALAHEGYSGHMWEDPSISHGARMQTFRLRWGLTWNRRQAARCNKALSSTCPLCTMEDGCTHIFSECQHPNMRGHYISRHNQAVKLIHKAVQQGGIGGCFSIVDATRQDDLPEGVESTRLPEWLLPSVPPEQLKRMRPDILVVEGMPANSAQAYQALRASYDSRTSKRSRAGGPGRHRNINDAQAFRAKCMIHVVEVGFTGNTRYMDKVAEKREQHNSLIQALRDEGWPVQYHIVVLGTGAFIFNDTVDALDNLKVPPAPKHSALLALHRLAAIKVHQIIVSRRKIEKEAAG